MAEEEYLERLSSVEEDEAITKLCNSKGVTTLSLIAPFAPLKLSPSESVYASLDPPEEFGIQTFIEKVKVTIPSIEDRKLYLLLHSPGGGAQSAYVIAKSLRKCFSEITAFVPHIGASGASLIALASNKIIMGEISRLSPIDLYRTLPNGTRVSCLAVIRGFSKLGKKYEKVSIDQIPPSYRHLIESMDLATWEEYTGLIDQMREYALELLGKAGYSKEKSEKIATRLTYEAATHGEVIDFDKAKQIGLNVEWYEEHSEDWLCLRRWLGKYLLEESAVHHIKYALPEKPKKEGKRK